MTTTTPAPPLALPELLHLVDRAERGVALAGEYLLLRDGIRALAAPQADLTALSAPLPASRSPRVPEPQLAPEKPSDARTAPQEGHDD